MVAAEPVTASGAAAFGVPGDIERQVAGKPGLRGQSLSVPPTSSHQVAAATVPWLGVNSAGKWQYAEKFGSSGSCVACRCSLLAGCCRHVMSCQLQQGIWQSDAVLRPL